MKRTCPKCKTAKPLTAKHWHRDGSAHGLAFRNGFQGVCKTCRRASARDYDAAVRAIRKETANRTEVSMCGKCKKNLPVSSFYRNTKSRTGREGICKSCREIKKKLDTVITSA